MHIVLYPRAAPSDRIRIWIGAFQATAPPGLTWTLDGIPTAPVALRDISSARTDQMLRADIPREQIPRVFTGVYEFTGLKANTLHTITAQADNVTTTLSVRTLPDEVPDGLDAWLNVLLVSCFHQAEDRRGVAGIIVSRLKSAFKPHLTLLMGDQVYLDLPTLKNFRDNPVWLAEKFENDYVLNWRGPLGYGQVLAAAPSISIPDDHEYWNNYPHASPFIENIWDSGGQDRWRAAAQAMYEAFQLAYPAKIGESVVLEISPLSFFLADTRSKKDPDRRFTMTDAAHQQLQAWVAGVIRKKLFPVFISGQSLFREPAGALAGGIGDYELPNYGDYAALMLSLRKFVDAGRPLICLTGDVHWGRVVKAIDINTGRAAFHEIISSPSSLVTTIGKDQFKEFTGSLGGLFGADNSWPRHSDPDKPPDFLASDIFQGRFRCSMIHPQRGNHVVLLSFRKHGNGLEVRSTYWPVSLDREIGAPREAEPFTLASL